MAHLSPYLRFNGNAREAFEFYKSCLGGQLTLTTVAESPDAPQMPGQQDKIFHASLVNGDVALYGSDVASDAQVTPGSAVSLTLSCATREEADTAFACLAAGGTIGHPITEQSFGVIGDLRDKYGIDWFIVVMQ